MLPLDRVRVVRYLGDAQLPACRAAERRDLLIAAEARRLAAHTDGPVIAAGSTGSMPATAALIETIAKLPHGAVVLPGLDTDLDEAAWDDIAGRHDAEGRTAVAVNMSCDTAASAPSMTMAPTAMSASRGPAGSSVPMTRQSEPSHQSPKIRPRANSTPASLIPPVWSWM